MNGLHRLTPQRTEDQLLREVQTILADYVNEARDPASPVVDYKSPDELADTYDFSLPNVGDTNTALPGLVRDYLRHSVRSSSPRFFNQLFGGLLLPGVVGEQVASVTNTSMYTYECAPMATLMEKAVIGEMTRLVGFGEGEGLLVTGGSNANLIAMNAARQRAVPEIKTQGFQGGQPLVVLVSDQAHYSFEKAAALMGLGTANVCRVGTDAYGRMDPSLLAAAIQGLRERGQRPFFVAVTAGTTVLGAFDPIEPIAALCASEGLWLHIDGSWGGSVALSETQRHLLRGSESADSFTWNPHKMMGLPLPCSAILLRQSGTLAQVHGGGGSEYLFHDDSSVPDLGPISLQCGRRVDALKLWLAWRCLGTTGFAQRIDHLFALCQKAKERVDREPLLELVREPVSVNIVFRYRPEGVDSDEELDRINILLRETLYRRGLALVNYATVDSTEVFRLVFANADLSTTDVNRLFDDLLACGTELFGKQGG